MNPVDLPIGIAISGFMATLCSSVWIIVAATLFQNRLNDELSGLGTSLKAIQLTNVGLSDIRELVGSESLGKVLRGYDAAITQTLYLPVALTVATIIGSSCVEWHSVKKEQDD